MPARENTVAASGSAGAPPEPVTHAPAGERPGQATTLRAGWTRWLAKIANEPSKPAKVQCGGVSASASWPSATTTPPPASDTDGGPAEIAEPCARTSTARPATGPVRVMPRLEDVVACARNQRVAPSGAVSPS